MNWQGPWDGPWDGEWQGGGGEGPVPSYADAAAALSGSAAVTGTLSALTPPIAAQPLTGRRSRRWRPLPEFLPELPQETRAELPKLSPAQIAATVVREFQERATLAARAEVETRQAAAEAENRAIQRRQRRMALATLARAELALREAENAAEAHMERLRQEDEWLLLS